MNCRLRFLFISFLLFSVGLHGQRPETVRILGKVNKAGYRSGCAGTSSGSFKIAKGSKNVSSSNMFLCFGDSLIITNTVPAKFSDPNPATSPGIGWVYYNCKPTKDGPALSDILKDNCLNKQSPILINNQSVNQTEGMWVAKEFPEGNIRFVNDGYQQATFNNGKPISIWFAPITMDQFSPDPTKAKFEANGSGISGACISQDTAQAIQVVYLNKLNISNISGKNNGGGNLIGSFTVTGGLPEFDPNSIYNQISIVRSDDPSQVGKLTNAPAKNGKAMTFAVPSPGTYDIIVSDSLGCSTQRAKVTFDHDPGVFKIGCGTAIIGQTVCVPISISQIPDLTTISFTLTFDPTQLQFVEAKNINPKLNQPVATTVVDKYAANGWINFLFFDLGLSKYDFGTEDKVIEFCFKAIGRPGLTPLHIVQNNEANKIKLEVTGESGGGISFPDSLGSILNCNTQILPSSTLNSYYFQCGKVLNGQITGGQSPYKLFVQDLPFKANKDSILTNSSSVFQIFDNKGSGKYLITVIDNSGASKIDTFNYDNTLNKLDVIFTPTNPSCKANDGAISATPVGGNPGTTGYIYEWSNVSTSQRITKLSEGKYYLTLKDGQGCTLRDSVTLVKLGIKAGYQITTPPTCSGIADGVILADPTGFSPPFKATWVGEGSQVGNTFRSVADKTVKLIVTDNAGCTDSISFSLTPRKVINLLTTVTNPRCFNNSDGILQINRAYSDGSQFSNDDISITNSIGQKTSDPLRPAQFITLKADTYKIHVMDGTGCFKDTTVMLTQPKQLDTLGVVVKPESCFPGKDGQIKIGVTGGTGPYRYTWNDIATNDSIRTGLSQGNYSVVIADANNCKTSIDSNKLKFAFKLPTFPVKIDTTPIKCFGQTAKLTATANATNPIKGYTWSTGDTTNTANALARIKTWVEVTDNQGCKGSDTVVLSQPAKLSLVDTIPSNLVIPNPCPGLSQGRINLSATGGTGPYTYMLSGGPTQNFGLFSKLASGTYTVTVTDANQCPSYKINVNLIEPPKIAALFDSTAFKAVKCFGIGDCSGQAKILVSGGTDPQNRFIIKWESGETTNNQLSSVADSLCAGNQKVQIIDGNGCSTTMSFNIPSPEAITRDPVRTTVSDVNCFGLKDGKVNYIAFGGTSPYRYTWSDGDTNSTRSGLAAGKYQLEVTDLNGCKFMDSLAISEPSKLLLSLDSIKTKPITCPDTKDGQIGLKISGSNGGYKFIWSPGAADTSFIRNIGPGVYSVTVVDAKGCRDSLKAIDLPAPPKLSIIYTNVFTPKCTGDTVGVFITSVSGGNGASYSFAINNGNSIPIANKAPLKAGSYQLTVFDRKGCALDTSITVVDPPRFNVDFGPDKSIRLGDSVRIVAIGNNPIAKVTWNQNGDITCSSTDCSIINAHPLKTTLLTATALDQNGCKATDQINIEVDQRRAVFIPNAFRPDQLSTNPDFRLFSGAGVINIRYGRIFNRWGDLVTEVQNLAPSAGGALIWDGRFKGGSADPGVYVYVINVEFADGQNLVYKGDVTLIR